MSTERLEPMTGCGILGILKCLAGMEGVLPIIHGPLSCSSGHRLAMLYAGVEPLLPTTNVTDPDIVLGTVERLRAAIRTAWAQYHPPLLAVILTCATSMAGEDFAEVLAQYEAETGARAVLLDGGALAGDELTAPYATYSALEDRLALTAGNGPAVILEGLARTDYGFAWEYPALAALAAEALTRPVLPGLFSGLNLSNTAELAAYRGAKRRFVGLLWRSEETPVPAPYGAEGTRRFLDALAQGRPLSDAALARYEGALKALFPLALALKKAALPVAVEGAGWQAYGLARFLKEELGCRVLLCVDQEHPGLAPESCCDEFYEDVGRFELVELIEGFGAQLVFGSSNVQDEEKWKYLPFFQPVWRTVEEPGTFLGFEGAVSLARRLLAWTEVTA